MKKVLNWTLLIIAVLAVRTTVGELYSIPSESMIPTLMVGDKIYVNKLSYGIKLPLSEWKKTIYLLEYNEPERGEVVVFNHPTGVAYVKRILAIPGDKIKIDGKDIYINGEKLLRDSISNVDFSKYMKENYSSVLKYEKETNGSNSYLVAYNKEVFQRQELPVITVPRNHYFVMGDDRDFSSDSRVWGFVPFDQIRGRVETVVASFTLGFKSEDFNLYLERTGNSVRQQSH